MWVGKLENLSCQCHILRLNPNENDNDRQGCPGTQQNTMSYRVLFIVYFSTITGAVANSANVENMPFTGFLG